MLSCVVIACDGAAATEGASPGSHLGEAAASRDSLTKVPTGAPGRHLASEPASSPRLATDMPNPESLSLRSHEPDLLMGVDEACEEEGPIPDDLVLIFAPGGRPSSDAFSDRAVGIVGTLASGRPMDGGRHPHDPTRAPWSAIDDWAEAELTPRRVRRAWCALMRAIVQIPFTPPPRCQPTAEDPAIRISAAWAGRRFIRELKEQFGCCPCPMELQSAQRELEADVVMGALPLAVEDFVGRTPKRCHFDESFGSVEAILRYQSPRHRPSSVDVIGDLPASVRTCIAHSARPLELVERLAPSEHGRTERYEMRVQWFNGRPLRSAILD